MLQEGNTFIICEQSQTHEGNLDLAKQLVKAAATAKADAVKFQVFTADELAVPAYQYYPLFKKLEWPANQWKELVDLCHSHGLLAMADVFGITSARMLVSIGIDALKVHGTDIRNRPLLEELARMDVPLLLSSGGAFLPEMKAAVDILTQHGKTKRQLVLMHGFQSYPTLIEHTNLLKMKLFGEALHLPFGFADHIDGDHVQNFSLCAMAIGMGAVIIEKHITSDRALKMEDYESALDPAAFIDFVAKIKDLDKAKGKAADELLDVEQKYRSAVRKHVVAIRPLSQGAKVTAQDVALKRVQIDETPADLENIIGKKTLRPIKEHEALVLKDVS